MPIFQYVARATDGRTVNGYSRGRRPGIRRPDAAGKGPDRDLDQGLRREGRRRARSGTGRGAVHKLDDMVVFSQQMAVMIRAGLPLIEVLDILAEQTERRSLANVVRQIEKEVEAGSSLTEAMAKHPNIFGQFYISMVRAGEASGMLDTILDQVANYLERIASLQRKIKSAVMYPATVTIIAIGITVFLLLKVVPVFEDIFKDLGGDLPGPRASPSSSPTSSRTTGGW